MGKFFIIDWAEMFLPTHSIAEMIVRGTIMYFALLMILRFVMVRQASTLALSDILVIVVIADAAQNAFAKEYQSITEGLVLVLTIVGWDVLLNALSYHFKLVGWLLAPAPLILVQNGQMLRRNMRREFITEDELLSQLRLQGVDELSEVRRACLEGNGEISVSKRDAGKEQKRPQRNRPI